VSYPTPPAQDLSNYRANIVCQQRVREINYR
jgi:hypothetical protein